MPITHLKLPITKLNIKMMVGNLFIVKNCMIGPLPKIYSKLYNYMGGDF